jgi:hypothetical protein
MSDDRHLDNLCTMLIGAIVTRGFPQQLFVSKDGKRWDYAIAGVDEVYRVTNDHVLGTDRIMAVRIGLDDLEFIELATILAQGCKEGDKDWDGAIYDSTMQAAD